MLLLFLFCSILRTISTASPLLPETLTSDDVNNVVDCQCPSIGQRSTWDILWSCLSTTFLVTWVSVHPNIPSPGESWWWVYWRRMKAVFWALVAPELIIFWAWRQRRGAREVMIEVNEHAKRYCVEGFKWSMVHGHFFQMGGFLLCQNGQTPRTLLLNALPDLLESGHLNLTSIMIPSEEIMDRSKSDGLTKCIAIIQTMWFIAQVIARRTQHLAITPLELTTVALASLNWVAFIFWWDKPFNVTCPVRVVTGRPPSNNHPSLSYVESQSGADPITTHCEGATLAVKNGSQEETLPGHFNQNRIISLSSSVLSTIAKPFTDISRAIAQRYHEQAERHGHTLATALLFDRAIFDPYHCLLGIGGIEKDARGERYCPHDRVGIFYVCVPVTTATYLEHFISRVTLTTIPGCIFGGLHLVAWHSTFPTSVEMLLWRASSVIMTTGALLSTTKMFFDIYPEPESRFKSVFWSFGAYTAAIGMAVNTVLCFPARLFLFVEGLAALRRLPDTAYETVDWQSIIPHI